jgi:glycosyltransferase involved in cell wall biosynthesis
MHAIFCAADMAPAADIDSPRRAGGDVVKLLYLRDTTIVCGPGKTIINTWRTLDTGRFALTIASTRPVAGTRNGLLDRAAALHADTVAVDIGGGVDLPAAWRLARLLTERRIDILQTHDSQTRRVGAVAARLAGVPHVTSVHGWIFNTSKERAARWVDKHVIRLADYVITISDRLKRDVMAAGTPADRICVLRNAILLDDYVAESHRTAFRQEMGIPEHHAVLSIIGRLSLEKGHAVFFEAAGRLASEFKALTFLVVGDGPLRQQLEDAASGADLRGRVVFAGHRTDMAAVYDATDVVVSSSYTEGVPNVLLEGFAYGRPAVATRVGGVPEIMSDGVEGWLVEAGQPDHLAERLGTLLRDPGLIKDMGARARVHVEQEFDFRRRTRQLEAVYERVIATRSAVS